MSAVSKPNRFWRMTRIILWMNAGIAISLREYLLQGRGWHSTPRGHKIVQTWLIELAKRLRLDINVTGKPIDIPHVQVVNHISWLDIVVLGAHHPVNFIAKSEIASWPLVGVLARMRGTCFIKRGSVSSLRAMVPVFQQRYEAGNNMVLFPESTTSFGDEVHHFHGALFQVMIDVEMPVQPVVLRYNGNREQRRKAAYIDDDRFLSHLWELCGCDSISVDLHYLAVKKSKDKQRRLLARACQYAIAEQLFPQDKPLTQAA